MMMVMMKMFLAVLLFQLLIQSTTGNLRGARDAQTQTFQYGDILAFPRTTRLFTLTHFAIYIDNIAERFPGRTEKGNLFHITGPFWGKVPVSDCVFGQMTDEITQTMKVRNYLDTMTGLSVPINIGSEADITNRINELLRRCPIWEPTVKNCEHLATYIRYGLHVSIQFGDTMEGKCHPRPTERKKLSKADETIVISELRRLYNEQDDEEYYRLMTVSA